MEKQTEIYKERDFSGIFSDGVNFLKAHFKGILKSFVLIVVPIYTIATVMVSLFSSKFINLFAAQASDPFAPRTTFIDNPSSILSIFGIYLLYGITLLLAITTIFSYIKVYSENTGDENITPSDVWKKAGPAALKLFGYFIVYLIIFIIPLWIVFFLFSLLMAVLMVIPIIGPIIMFLGVIFFGLVIGTYFTVLIPVIIYERAGIFGSFSRTSALLKGSFWQTMGVTVVSVLLVQLVFYGLYFAFLLLLQSFDVFTTTPDVGLIKILLVVFAIIAPLFLFFGYLFQYSISSFTYYSLVEKLDHVGLNMKVEGMGDEDLDKPAEEY
jgi:hypothetical protein